MPVKPQPIKPHYDPYIGKSYSIGIGGDHYLIVGVSHTCLPGRRKRKYRCSKEDCSECLLLEDKCPPLKRKCPLLEDCKNEDKDNCTDYIKLSCETKFGIYDHIKDTDADVNPVFDCFYEFGKRLRELGILKTDVDRTLWHKVGFCNYIQVITTNKSNSPTDIPEKYWGHSYFQMFIASFKSFTPLPDVIVVLYKKEIKEIISKNLSELKGNFKEIKQLSEKNKYYVFANEKSKLYEKYVFRLLKEYTPFINENKGKYKGNYVLATAIAYHFTKGNWDKESIKKIAKELQEEYGLLSEGVNIKSINRSFNRLKNNKTGSKEGGVQECYDSLISFLGK